jgi:hypothetical protein
MVSESAQGHKKNLPERADFLLPKGQPPEGDGIRVCPWAQEIETSQNSLDTEEFLAGLRFEQKGNLDKLPIF